MLSREGHYAAAEPLLREAVDIRREKLGPDHPAVAVGLDQLATLLRERGDLAEAEPLLVASLTDLRGRPGAGLAAAHLVRLYEAWGRPEAARAYRGLAAAL
jgi:hypothetical protein